MRLLSAPCGLVRDLTQAGAELRALDPGLLETLELHALDIDERGDVIPEATRRAAAADLPVSFHREDLFDPRGLTARVRDDGRSTSSTRSGWPRGCRWTRWSASRASCTGGS